MSEEHPYGDAENHWTLDVDDTRPRLDYPEVGIRDKGDDYPFASVEKATFPPGHYQMDGVLNFVLWENKEPLEYTVLKIEGDTVMTDSPKDWWGMVRLAEAAHGRVLVGGLGLGILVQHLVKNDKVTSIEVVEMNEHVIDLVKPWLPNDERIKITEGDFFFAEHGKYDTVICDILVISEDGVKTDMGFSPIEEVRWWVMRMEWTEPDTDVFVWGFAEPKWNPAVSDDEHVKNMCSRLSSELRKRDNGGE